MAIFFIPIFWDDLILFVCYLCPIFLKILIDFKLKIKSILSNIKIQNGVQIKDGRQNVFIG
jgi:hypothetical protein